MLQPSGISSGHDTSYLFAKIDESQHSIIAQKLSDRALIFPGQFSEILNMDYQKSGIMMCKGEVSSSCDMGEILNYSRKNIVERPLVVIAQCSNVAGGENPYTKLLYEGMADQNVVVHPYSRRALLFMHPDIIHVHWPEFLVRWEKRSIIAVADILKELGLIWLAKCRGARLVWTAHDLGAHDRPKMGWRYAWFIRCFNAMADKIISLSPAALDAVREHYPAIKDVPATVIPHGHYIGYYGDANGLDSDIANLEQCDPALMTYLVFGQIRQYKNVSGLIRAFSANNTKARLIIAGEIRGTEAFRAELSELAQSTPNVILIPKRISDSEVCALHRHADVVILPYHQGSALHSGAAILALSLNRPVVVRDTPTMRDLRNLVGADWVTLFDGEPSNALSVAQDLRFASRQSQPDLSALDPHLISIQTVAAYQAALTGGRKRASLISRIAGLARFRIAQIKEALGVIRAPVLSAKFNVASKPIRIPSIDGICNPSIVRTQSGWLIAARRPNYRMDATGAYTISGGIQNLRSETYLMECDENLEIRTVQKVDDRQAKAELPVAQNGFEDPRIFWNGSQLMGLWSALRLGPQPTISTPPVAGEEPITCRPVWRGTTNTMVLAQLNDAKIEVPIVLPSPTGATREKNWIPCVRNGYIHLIYFLKNMEVYRVCDEKLQPVYCAPTPIASLIEWSGSSQLIEWEGNWLCVAHLAGRRIKHSLKTIGPFYFHRLVLLSSDWKVVGLSAPFFFERKGLEFCAGLAAHNDRVIFTYGLDDNSASSLELSRAEVNAMLRH